MIRSSIKNVCVYCGSSPGARPEYADAAIELGRELARRDLGLVYGGSNIGLMGRVADAVLEAGGLAIGVMPVSLQDKEIAHPGLTRLEIVPTLQERKDLMAELSDAFIALPGGFGTLDELLEILTYAQLGLHDKPSGVLNINGYFDSMLAFFDHATAERFLQPGHRDMVLTAREPARLLDAFTEYTAPTVEKWVERPLLA